MLLKIDLHVHTKRYSLCSILSPEKLCEVALQRGLNAVVIMEHNHQWSRTEIAGLQAQYPSLKLYAGVEIDCTDGRHYGILGLDAGSYQPNPMPYPELRARLDDHPDAFSFIAHCFRYSDDETELDKRQVDGFELGNYNLLVRPQPVSGPIVLKRAGLHRQWQQKMGWKALYNSDTHSEKTLGTFYNVIETEKIPPDEAALAGLLRQADIQPFQDDALIRRVINEWL